MPRSADEAHGIGASRRASMKGMVRGDLMRRWALLVILLWGQATVSPSLPPTWLSAEVAQGGRQGRVSPSLEEHGQFSRWSGEAPATIRIVSYNIHLGRKLEQILATFRSHPELSRADVLALQEVVRDPRTSQARVLAERLELNYVYLPGKKRGDREIGLALLSRYPILDVERIVLPQERRPDDLPRIALGATIAIGATRLRLYNLHVQALVPVELKVRQVEAALQSALRQATPHRLILGDFNTLTRGDRRALDRALRHAGFSPALPGSAWTYRRLLIRMTLDWIYVQNLRVLGHGVAQEVTASDHRPIWVDVALPSPNEQ